MAAILETITKMSRERLDLLLIEEMDQQQSLEFFKTNGITLLLTEEQRKNTDLVEEIKVELINLKSEGLTLINTGIEQRNERLVCLEMTLDYIKKMSKEALAQIKEKNILNKNFKLEEFKNNGIDILLTKEEQEQGTSTIEKSSIEQVKNNILKKLTAEDVPSITDAFNKRIAKETFFDEIKEMPDGAAKLFHSMDVENDLLLQEDEFILDTFKVAIVAVFKESKNKNIDEIETASASLTEDDNPRIIEMLKKRIARKIIVDRIKEMPVKSIHLLFKRYEEGIENKFVVKEKGFDFDLDKFKKEGLELLLKEGEEETLVKEVKVALELLTKEDVPQIEKTFRSVFEKEEQAYEKLKEEQSEEKTEENEENDDEKEEEEEEEDEGEVEKGEKEKKAEKLADLLHNIKEASEEAQLTTEEKDANKKNFFTDLTQEIVKREARKQESKQSRVYLIQIIKEQKIVNMRILKKNNEKMFKQLNNFDELLVSDEVKKISKESKNEQSSSESYKKIIDNLESDPKPETFLGSINKDSKELDNLSYDDEEKLNKTIRHKIRNKIIEVMKQKKIKNYRQLTDKDYEEWFSQLKNEDYNFIYDAFKVKPKNVFTKSEIEESSKEKAKTKEKEEEENLVWKNAKDIIEKIHGLSVEKSSALKFEDIENAEKLKNFCINHLFTEEEKKADTFKKALDNVLQPNEPYRVSIENELKSKVILSQRMTECPKLIEEYKIKIGDVPSKTLKNVASKRDAFIKLHIDANDLSNYDVDLLIDFVTHLIQVQLMATAIQGISLEKATAIKEVPEVSNLDELKKFIEYCLTIEELKPYAQKINELSLKDYKPIREALVSKSLLSPIMDKLKDPDTCSTLSDLDSEAKPEVVKRYLKANNLSSEADKLSDFDATLLRDKLIPIIRDQQLESEARNHIIKEIEGLTLEQTMVLVKNIDKIQSLGELKDYCKKTLSGVKKEDLNRLTEAISTVSPIMRAFKSKIALAAIIKVIKGSKHLPKLPEKAFSNLTPDDNKVLKDFIEHWQVVLQIAQNIEALSLEEASSIIKAGSDINKFQTLDSCKKCLEDLKIDKKIIDQLKQEDLVPITDALFSKSLLGSIMTMLKDPAINSVLPPLGQEEEPETIKKYLKDNKLSVEVDKLNNSDARIIGNELVSIIKENESRERIKQVQQIVKVIEGVSFRLAQWQEYWATLGKLKLTPEELKPIDDALLSKVVVELVKNTLNKTAIKFNLFNNLDRDARPEAVKKYLKENKLSVDADKLSNSDAEILKNVLIPIIQNNLAVRKEKFEAPFKDTLPNFKTFQEQGILEKVGLEKLKAYGEEAKKHLTHAAAIRALFKLGVKELTSDQLKEVSVVVKKNQKDALDAEIKKNSTEMKRATHFTKDLDIHAKRLDSFLEQTNEVKSPGDEIERIEESIQPIKAQLSLAQKGQSNLGLWDKNEDNTVLAEIRSCLSKIEQIEANISTIYSTPLSKPLKEPTSPEVHDIYSKQAKQADVALKPLGKKIIAALRNGDDDFKSSLPPLSTKAEPAEVRQYLEGLRNKLGLGKDDNIKNLPDADVVHLRSEFINARKISLETLFKRKLPNFKAIDDYGALYTNSRADLEAYGKEAAKAQTHGAGFRTLEKMLGMDTTLIGFEQNTVISDFVRKNQADQYEKNMKFTKVSANDKIYPGYKEHDLHPKSKDVEKITKIAKKVSKELPAHLERLDIFLRQSEFAKASGDTNRENREATLERIEKSTQILKWQLNVAISSEPGKRFFDQKELADIHACLKKIDEIEANIATVYTSSPPANIAYLNTDDTTMKATFVDSYDAAREEAKNYFGDAKSVPAGGLASKAVSSLKLMKNLDDKDNCWVPSRVHVGGNEAPVLTATVQTRTPSTKSVKSEFLWKQDDLKRLALIPNKIERPWGIKTEIPDLAVMKWAENNIKSLQSMMYDRTQPIHIIAGKFPEKLPDNCVTALVLYCKKANIPYKAPLGFDNSKIENRHVSLFEKYWVDQDKLHVSQKILQKLHSKTTLPDSLLPKNKVS